MKFMWGRNSARESYRADRVEAGSAFLPLLPRGRVDNVLFRAQVGLREEALPLPELLRQMDRAASLGEALVFPSHFFAYPQKEACLARLAEIRLPFFVQLSPGAELAEYGQQVADWLRMEGLKPGIELVMDRAPHHLDWERMERWPDLPTRFVFCPVHEFPPMKVLGALPERVLDRLYFFFPAKSAAGSFLTADEIFLLLQKVEKEMPELKVRLVEHLPLDERDSAESEFRRNPSADA